MRSIFTDRRIPRYRMQEHRFQAIKVNSLPCLEKNLHKQTESLHILVGIQVGLHTQRSQPWLSRLKIEPIQASPTRSLGELEPILGIRRADLNQESRRRQGRLATLKMAPQFANGSTCMYFCRRAVFGVECMNLFKVRGPA